LTGERNATDKILYRQCIYSELAVRTIIVCIDRALHYHVTMFAVCDGQLYIAYAFSDRNAAELITVVRILSVFHCVHWSTGETSLIPARITFNMIGKFGISGAFAVVCLYTPEIFPTTLRFR